MKCLNHKVILLITGIKTSGVLGRGNGDVVSQVLTHLSSKWYPSPLASLWPTPKKERQRERRREREK